jgi:hypothetical protein
VASARAIEMRWRWPPENWCGYLAMSSGLRPTDLQQLAHALAQRAGSVMRPCSAAARRRCLPPSSAGSGWRTGPGRSSGCAAQLAAFGRVLNAACASCPSKVRPPRVGAYRPTSRRATVLLPQPDSPTSASVLPFSISKAHAVHRMQQLARLAFEHAVEPGRRDVEGLGQVVRAWTRARRCLAGITALTSTMGSAAHAGLVVLRRNLAGRPSCSQQAARVAPACSRSGRSRVQRAKTRGQRGL